MRERRAPEPTAVDLAQQADPGDDQQRQQKRDWVSEQEHAAGRLNRLRRAKPIGRGRPRQCSGGIDAGIGHKGDRQPHPERHEDRAALRRAKRRSESANLSRQLRLEVRLGARWAARHDLPR